jgi:hypothetical protein
MGSDMVIGSRKLKSAARLVASSCLLAVLATVFCLSVGTSSAAAAGEWSNPTLLDPWWGISSLSCASTTHCVAVGSGTFGGGLAASYNGTSWSLGVDVSGTTQLQAASCPSTSRCVAVGGTDAVVDNAGKWEAPEPVDSGGHLVSVSCGSETFCAATDEEGFALIFKSGKWATREDVDGSAVLESVSCAGEFCAAVDGGGGALTYSSGKWSAPESIDGSHALHAVSCLSTNFCIAVDDDGNALTFSAGKWSAPASIDGTTHLISVSCTTESHCVAGAEGQGTLVDSSGTWTLGTTIGGRTSCVFASTFCAVTDGNGDTSNFSGGTWSTPEDFGGEFGNVSCTTVSYCVATDETGHVLVYAGGKWSEREEVLPGGYHARPISCPTSSFCAAANGEHVVVYNGTTWTTVAGLTDSSMILTMSCSGASFCVAGDAHGNFIVDHAGVWSNPAASGDGGNALDGLSCSTETFCIAVDEPGEALIYNGVTWGSPEPTHVFLSGSGQSDLSCAPGTKFCVTVTESGKDVKAYSKGSWGAPVSVGVEGVSLVSCTSESFCVVESFDGRFASTYDGTSWSAPQPLPGTEDGGPWALSCGTPSLCVLLEEDGHALTYANTGAAVPVSTGLPTVTGLPEESQTLTEHHGTWTNTPTGYVVQWERCNASGLACTAVASGPTYPLTSADIGSTLRAIETASNAAGQSEPADSEHTPIVAAAKSSGGGGGSAGSGGGGTTATTTTVVKPPVTPAPVVGQRQTVSLVSGTVLVRLKGSSRFVPLSAVSSIPDGSEADATNGRVIITVATAHGTVSAEVYGGRFVLHQDHTGNDETHFALSLPLTGCPRVALPHGSAAAVASRSKHGPKSRHLWVSEHGGSWGTNGRYVSTTVEGTRWLTLDECSRSEVKIAAGKVKVRDLVRKKTKTVGAGQSYVASGLSTRRGGGA